MQTFDINALLKLDQDLSAEVSKVSCADESALHNTIKSQDGEHDQGSYQITLDVPGLVLIILDYLGVDKQCKGTIATLCTTKLKHFSQACGLRRITGCPKGSQP